MLFSNRKHFSINVGGSLCFHCANSFGISAWHVVVAWGAPRRAPLPVSRPLGPGNGVQSHRITEASWARENPHPIPQQNTLRICFSDENPFCLSDVTPEGFLLNDTRTAPPFAVPAVAHASGSSGPAYTLVQHRRTRSVGLCPPRCSRNGRTHTSPSGRTRVLAGPRDARTARPNTCRETVSDVAHRRLRCAQKNWCGFHTAPDRSNQRPPLSAKLRRH